MMMNYFLYHEYEFQDLPKVQPLPDLRTRKAAVQEQEWLALQGHPILDTIQILESEYRKYPKNPDYMNPLRRLQMVAYGAHPLLGARAMHRLADYIRISHHANDEFEAMTLASDTFAGYAFAIGLAADCADHAAECAQLAAKPAEIIQAWRDRAAKLKTHNEANLQ
jgi:hypothetical protein